MDGRPAHLGCKAKERLSTLDEDRRSPQRHHGHHPSLSDDRRLLPDREEGQVIEAADDFMLLSPTIPAAKYSQRSETKHQATKFMAIEFDYPVPEIEAQVVEREAE